jgi:hypothetical protein
MARPNRYLSQIKVAVLHQCAYRQLQTYSKNNKFFAKNNAYEGGLLRFLLRESLLELTEDLEQKMGESME